MPIFVPGATSIAPVVGFKVMPAGHTPTCDIVLLVKLLGKPLVLSFANTFTIGVPPVNAFTIPVSVVGLITGVTTTVSVFVAQVVGVNLSHN